MDLPVHTARAFAEPLQLLHYPDGGHYGCHFDVNERDQYPRFVTFFMQLNTPSSGGETVFYGPGIDHSKELPWQRWRDLEQDCQPNVLCPPPADHHVFANATVVKPQEGQAIFWYNAEVEENGTPKRVIPHALHAGCPVNGEKWGANIWVISGTGGHTIRNGLDDDLQKLEL